MKITEIFIKGLYGSYTYHIKGLDSQNLLVLTGYNGMGKTTLLNVVKNIAESNLWFFYELEFEELNVSFEEGLTLSMKSEKETSPSMTGKMETSDENVSPEKYLTYEWYRDSALLSGVRVNRHTFYKAFSVVFKKEFVSEESDWETEMSSKMREIVSYICKKQNAMSFEMIQSSIKAFMIPAQRVKQIRLVTDEEERFFFPSSKMEEIDTIDLVAENFGKMLDRKRIEFLSSIQNSKNHLMDRLLNADTQVLSEDEYESIARDAQAKIDDLSQFGIVYERVRPYSQNSLGYDCCLAFLGRLNPASSCLPTTAQLETFENEHSEEVDNYHFVRGHDLCEMISLLLKVHSYYNKNSNVNVRRVQEALGMAYNVDKFRRTQLYSSISNWFENHGYIDMMAC